MAFVYDLNDHGLLKTAFRWSHTVWPSVLQAPGFWMFFILHITLWACYHYHLGDETFRTGLLDLQWDDLQIISGLTTFFEVFYTNQCYNTYFQMNAAINQTFRSAHRLCYDLKLYTFSAGPKCTWIASRWMRLSLVVFYVELRHGSLQAGHWVDLQDIGLVTSEEAEYLNSLPSAQRSMAMLNWIGQAIICGHRRSELNDPTFLRMMLQRLTEFDERQRQVMDIVRMPVPFQYYHLLNVMVGMNVALWAYKMALTHSIFGPVVFFFASTIFIAMLELAKQLSDVFGNDDVDFPLHIWLSKFVQNSIAFVASDYPGDAGSLERALEIETGDPCDAREVGNMYLGESDLGEDPTLTKTLTTAVSKTFSTRQRPSIRVGRGSYAAHTTAHTMAQEKRLFEALQSDDDSSCHDFNTNPESREETFSNEASALIPCSSREHYFDEFV